MLFMLKYQHYFSLYLALAAVRSKAVVVLLFPHCLLLLPLFVGVFWFGACFIMLYLKSLLVLQSSR